MKLGFTLLVLIIPCHLVIAVSSIGITDFLKQYIAKSKVQTLTHNETLVEKMKNLMSKGKEDELVNKNVWSGILEKLMNRTEAKLNETEIPLEKTHSILQGLSSFFEFNKNSSMEKGSNLSGAVNESKKSNIVTSGVNESKKIATDLKKATGGNLNELSNSYHSCVAHCKLSIGDTNNNGVSFSDVPALQNCFQECKNKWLKTSNDKVALASSQIAKAKKGSYGNKRKNGLFYQYVTLPIKKFLFTLLFFFVALISFLYYFKAYSLYPRFSNYITEFVEASYDDDEIRLSKTDFYPGSDNMKMKFVYFIRCNFLPQFFVNQFPWLFPARRYTNYYTEMGNSDYYIHMKP